LSQGQLKEIFYCTLSPVREINVSILTQTIRHTLQEREPRLARVARRRHKQKTKSSHKASEAQQAPWPRCQRAGISRIAPGTDRGQLAGREVTNRCDRLQEPGSAVESSLSADDMCSARWMITHRIVHRSVLLSGGKFVHVHAASTVAYV